MSKSTMRLSEAELVNYLTFCSYKHNRSLAPEVTPEQWKAVYGPSVDAMEARLQGLFKVKTIPDKQPPEERDREDLAVGGW